MAVDDSFKKPGAIPFKWELKPGVPKHQHHHKNQPPSVPPPPPPLHSRTAGPVPQKLKPPPSGPLLFLPPPEPRAGSFRSAPRTRSDRWRFDQPVMVRRESVSSAGCFFSPLLRRKSSIKRASSRPRADSETDYTSDLETLARWSVSSRKSFASPFRGSPSSSSFSSYQSSPRPVSDAEWAGFGLF
ncbi:hypothetical protein FNV43_RR12201 [Rhamnella rubrinervis]|uniref:Uncharacterized protein n=1 Tax=Rhamnella rubrinervis TaxID=2594499 RepID=A0A8K0MIB3_9ROSA|nr:hypothetical protein FNV43_RR12201 [Rhamnella rubrinervis]